MPLIIWIVAFPNDRCLLATALQMPVKTINRCIQRTISIPVYMQIIGIIGNIADLAVRLHPVDALAMCIPERIRIGNRRLI